MGFPLEPLLSVRRYREESAQSALRIAEREYREALAEAERRREALERFKAWREEEVERRYDAVMGKPLALSMLEEFKAGLGDLERRELMHEEAARAAVDVAEEKRAAVDKAKNAVSATRKETAKIETLKDLWREETRKEAEYKEELELEDFHASPPAGLEADDNATQGAES